MTQLFQPSKPKNIVQLLHDWPDRHSPRDLRQGLGLASWPHFAVRLDQWKQLNWHTGCVNAMDWNAGGDLLASVSDDEHLLVWAPFRHTKKPLFDAPTLGQGIMFDVKFVDGHRLLTASNRGCIQLFDVGQGSSSSATALWSCRCQKEPVRSVAATGSSPGLIWAAFTKGCVLQYDTRQNCRTGKVVIRLEGGATALAINEHRPHQLAIGAQDSYARLYDRRMVGSAVQYYRPNFDWARDGVSHLTFSPNDGDELLVSLGNDHVYVFDVLRRNGPQFADMAGRVAGSRRGSPGRGGSMLPQPVRGMCERAILLLRAGKKQRAIAVLTEAIDLRVSRDGIRNNEEPFAELFFFRGRALLERAWLGDAHAALLDLKRAMDMQPTKRHFHLTYVQALVATSRLALAQQFVDEVRRVYPPKYVLPGWAALDAEIALAKSQLGKETAAVQVSANEQRLREQASDYAQRFVGPVSLLTNIKRAAFFGGNSELVVAGSDCGHVFMWDRRRDRVCSVKKSAGDGETVNVVLPHPKVCAMAISGLAHNIQIWQPNCVGREKRPLRYLDNDKLEECLDKNQKDMLKDAFMYSIGHFHPF